MHLPRLAGLRLAAPAALALLFLAAGCTSDGGQSRPPRNSARSAPFTPIGGQETFFNGVIRAEVLVGAMTGFNAGYPGAKSEGGSGGGKRRHGGMPGGGGPGGGMGGPPPGGWTGGGGDLESTGNATLRRADAMASPPVMIHLRFTNKGSEKVDLVIADFVSPFGNFVVRPDRLALAPGQSLEVDPMTSRLADEATSGEATLSLKLGKDSETKTVTLQPKPDAAASLPPPPDAQPKMQ